jgi:hypothetical protein
MPGIFDDIVYTDGRYVAWSEARLHLNPDEVILGVDLATGEPFEVALPAVQSPVGVAGDLVQDLAHGVLVWVRQPDVPTSHPLVCAASLGTVDLSDATAVCNPGFSSNDWTYFPETGQYTLLEFRAYWEANGGLPVFGYPLTAEGPQWSAERGDYLRTQYFERQRFEWHPENAGTPYEVLLGRLGAELLESQGRDWTTFPKADPATPHYVAETGHAIDDRFWAYWSGHGLELGDSGVSYRESVALFGYPLSEPMLETNADGDTVLTQYFERAVLEWHPDNPEPYKVLLRRLGAELSEPVRQ